MGGGRHWRPLRHPARRPCRPADDVEFCREICLCKGPLSALSVGCRHILLDLVRPASGSRVVRRGETARYRRPGLRALPSGRVGMNPARTRSPIVAKKTIITSESAESTRVPPTATFHPTRSSNARTILRFRLSRIAIVASQAVRIAMTPAPHATRSQEIQSPFMQPCGSVTTMRRHDMPHTAHEAGLGYLACVA